MLKLLDFYADWCGPCKAMKPIFEEFEEDFGDKIEFESIDVEAEGALAAEYEVMSIPTFIILKDGEEISRRLGAMPKETFREWLEENL